MYDSPHHQLGSPSPFSSVPPDVMFMSQPFHHGVGGVDLPALIHLDDKKNDDMEHLNDIIICDGGPNCPYYQA